MDREKVVKDNIIRGLRSAIEISGPLVCLRKEHAKAILALLKEQEKPILSIDEAVSELIDNHYERLKGQEADKPKGHWIPYEPDKRGYADGFTCSRCERVILSDHYCKMIDFDFCPYCGAYMDNAEGR